MAEGKHKGNESVGGSGNGYEPKHSGGQDAYEWANAQKPKDNNQPKGK